MFSGHLSEFAFSERFQYPHEKFFNLSWLLLYEMQIDKI